MTLPNNYTNIIAAVQELAEDDDTEFVAYIPTAIFLAEERLFKDLNLRRKKELASVSLAAESNTVTKPTGYRYGYSVVAEDASGNKILLKKCTEDFLDDFWPNEADLGTPKYYTDDDEDNFRVAPTPETAYTIKITYNKKPTALSTSNLTNYYTEYYPDALFYAVMSAMAEYMKDYSVRQVWEDKVQLALQGGLIEAKVYDKEDGSPKTNPEPNMQEK